MKKMTFLLGAVALAAGLHAHAQSDMIIKQRAKALRDANDAQVRAQEGRDTPAAPAANQPAATQPAPAAPAPPPSQVDLQLKQNLEKLQTDLTTIKPGAPASDDVKQLLQADFATLAKGSIRPSATNLSKLAVDLGAAFSGPGTAIREPNQLAQAINVVVNSSMYTAAQAQSFIVVAQTTLKSSGVPEASVETLTSDLKAILAEVQKKKPKLYQ